MGTGLHFPAQSDYITLICHLHRGSEDSERNDNCLLSVERTFALTTTQLPRLHDARFAVEIEIQGELRYIYGRGVYDPNDPDLGSVLRILVDDPCGDFEFLIPEPEWSGRIESSHIPGCDYRVSLGN
jgi:hypothetical protein